jgi:chromosome segregation ATPase
MEKLQEIKATTGIGTEFVGIYNDNNRKVKESVDELESGMESLSDENERLRRRVSELSGAFEKLISSYGKLTDEYTSTLNALQEINDKLDDITGQQQ